MDGCTHLEDQWSGWIDGWLGIEVFFFSCMLCDDTCGLVVVRDDMDEK